MCSFVVPTDELQSSGGPVQTDIDPRNLIGRKALDRNGAKIGTVDEVYLDDATGIPEWAAIRTGLFSRDAFVPLEPSELVEGSLRVPFDRALIKDAPDFGVGRHLSPEQELQLYHHYGLDVTPPGLPPDRDFGRLAGTDET
nr:PRC-barrel domain containing protein [Streptomyces sp. RPA4-2]